MVNMTRVVKIYIAVTTIALLGFMAFFSFTLILGRAQQNESPEIIGNIVVSGRLVTPSQLDELFQDPVTANPKRMPKSGLYLVTRAWLKDLPTKRVISARVEFLSPEFLKGRRVSIGGGFLGETGYNVEPLEFVGHMTEEQRNIALSAKPELKVVNAWVK
jgi:hypothetical protein